MSESITEAKTIYAGHPKGNLLRLNQFDFDKLRLNVGPEVHTGERWLGRKPEVAKLSHCEKTEGGVVRAEIIIPDFAPPTYLEQIDTGAAKCKFGTPRYGSIKLRIPDRTVNVPQGRRKSAYPDGLDRTGFEVVRIHEVERVIMSDSGGVFWEGEI